MVEIVRTLFQVFYWLLIARLLLSWIPIQSPNKTVREIISAIYNITEFYLRPFRNLVPAVGNLDLSPIIGLFALQIIRNVIISLLRSGGF